MKNPKLIIGIVAILVLFIIFYLVYKNSKKVTKEVKGTTVQQAGFFDSLLNLFNPKPSSGSGSNAQTIWCQLFPKSCQSNVSLKCDCKNPGYDLSGDLRPNCTEGIGEDWIAECK